MVLNTAQSSWTQARMPISHRAKQFAPFAALRGLPEALAKKEKVHVPKRTLTQSAAEELDRMLHWVRVGQRVTITYYAVDPDTHTGEYLRLTGLVSQFSLTHRVLSVARTTVPFANLLELRLESDDGDVCY